MIFNDILESAILLSEYCCSIYLCFAGCSVEGIKRNNPRTIYGTIYVTPCMLESLKTEKLRKI